MDLHSILNRVIQTINPVTISHEPALLYATFKDSLRECSIGKFAIDIQHFIYLQFLI